LKQQGSMGLGEWALLLIQQDSVGRVGGEGNAVGESPQRSVVRGGGCPGRAEVTKGGRERSVPRAR
jgi:hypothetical protein